MLGKPSAALMNASLPELVSFAATMWMIELMGLRSLHSRFQGESLLEAEWIEIIEGNPGLENCHSA